MALKPDGMFLAAMLGGETLRELRIACTVAQLEREGGISARVSPLVQVQDAGNLLTGAGFALPTVDTDKYILRYPSGVLLFFPWTVRLIIISRIFQSEFPLFQWH
eukprot:c22314_g1_i1 orf=1-312(-)